MSQFSFYKTPILILFLLSLPLPLMASAENFSTAEIKIIKQLDIQDSDARELLERLVNINSGTMNFAGVKKVGQVLSREYENLGFETEWIDGKAFERAGHLVARYGNSGVRLLLIGHLDTVFTADSAFQNYQVLEDAKVRGPGVTDMKGGNVIMWSALKALKETALLENISVRVVLTGDEEKRGKPMALANKALLEAGEWADIAIAFEDGDGDPTTAVISRRGASGWKLQVSGRPAHSSQIFRKGYGDGAIYEASRILDQFRKRLSSLPNLTFNPGLIVGGTEAKLDSEQATGMAAGKDNVIARTVYVSGDIRAVSPEQLRTAQAMMEKIVADNLPETSAKIEFKEGYPPMAVTEGNQSLLQLYDAISRQLGYGEVRAVDPRKAGAADVSFVAGQVDMAIDGIGLMGSGGHTEKETADMTTFLSQTRKAAILIYRLGQLYKKNKEQ